MCEPSWQQSRVGLIISQFASSILVIVFGVFLPLILIIARKLYRHFHKKVRNYVVYGFIDKGEYVICLLSHTQCTRGGRLYESVHMYGNMWLVVMFAMGRKNNTNKKPLHSVIISRTRVESLVLLYLPGNN